MDQDIMDNGKTVPIQSSEETFGLQLIDGEGQITQLSELPIFIGRGEQNQIRLSESSVSLVHAQIYYDETIQSVCLSDHDSLNGLHLNGKPTRKNVLTDGDSISFGSVTLTFRDTGYIPPTPTKPGQE